MHRVVLPTIAATLLLAGCAEEGLEGGPVISINSEDAAATDGGGVDVSETPPDAVTDTAVADDAKQTVDAPSATDAGQPDVAKAADTLQNPEISGSDVVSTPTCDGSSPTMKCAENEACVGGKCVVKVCAVGTTTCAGDSLLTCGGKGTTWLTTACDKLPQKHLCKVVGGKAMCTPLLCTPGDTVCAGDKRMQCAVDGLSFEPLEDCATKPGGTCKAGKCEAPACTPKTLFCIGDTVRYCDSTCQGSTVVKKCEAGQGCWQGTCQKKICNPGDATCTDAGLHAVCVANGTQQVAQPCGKGDVCKAGKCTPKLCTLTLSPGTPTAVDVVMLVSTVYQMQEEIGAVGEVISKLAQALVAEQLDARMVLVAKDTFSVKLVHTAQSTFKPGMFLQVHKAVTHYNALLHTVGGPGPFVNDFKVFLRLGSSKHAIVAADTDSLLMKANDFHNQLLTVKHPTDPLGDPLFSGYRFHSLAGFGSTPVKGCPTALQEGKQYAELSAMTKGQKIPICGMDSTAVAGQLFDAIKAAMSKPGGCEYGLPAAVQALGSALKAATVTYSLGSTVNVPLVNSKAACGNQQGWYLAPISAGPKAVGLCPATCSDVNGLDISFTYPCG